jgi:cyclophilin family peptidyl-prolyl cis-trans isomerase
VAKTYTATVKTDVGSFTITLLAKQAPLAVNNFVFLAGYHYYDGIVFQRVIKGFVDQGGDPLGSGLGGPGYRFDDELPSSSSAYIQGVVGMANAGPNTNGSQFFVAAAGLAGKVKPTYTVFGLVTQGMSVVDAINKDGSTGGTPTVTHHIISVTINEF